MSRSTIRAFGALGTLLLTVTVVTPAFAIDKEQRQLMADVRMLQEQNQQLQNLLASIAESIKAVNARMDDQANATRKAQADQKLVIDNLTNDVRVISEKLDDNSVRVGSLGQEIDALRQSVSAMNAPRPFGFEADAAAAGGTTAPDAQVPSGAAAIGTSPKKLLDSALADYFGGQYDLAALGFESYVKTFPQSTEAPEAQLRAGNSYLQLGKYDKAVDAYDLAIRNYSGAPELPDAYYRKGLALTNLKQLDRAREAFEYIVKTYPQSAAATLAQQKLAQPAR